MNTELDLERELFTIIFDGGQKDFKYWGFSGGREDDADGLTHQITEVCFCEGRLKRSTRYWDRYLDRNERKALYPVSK